MCVVCVVYGERPTEAQVKAMYESNKHGAGVAWREDGLVHWHKGLLLEEVQELNLSLPTPYVLHFRIPSHGTSTDWGACHPFPIEEQVSLDLEGTIKGAVLFHNGHWGGWKGEILKYAATGGYRIPSGVWSDSRALAWMAHHFSEGVLHLLEEKVCVFSMDDIELIGDWKKEGGLVVSNDAWKHKLPYFNTVPNRMQVMGPVNKEGTGGAPRHAGFRGTQGTVDATVQGGQTWQEGSQAGAEENREGDEEAAETLGLIDVEEGVDGIWTAISSPKDRKCATCGSSKGSGVVKNGIKQCWQCWDPKKESINLHQDRISQSREVCPECNINKATVIRVLDDVSICRACWQKAGMPSIYYNSAGLTENLKARRDAFGRGIQVLGPM